MVFFFFFFTQCWDLSCSALLLKTLEFRFFCGVLCAKYTTKKNTNVWADGILCFDEECFSHPIPFPIFLLYSHSANCRIAAWVVSKYGSHRDSRNVVCQGSELRLHNEGCGRCCIWVRCCSPFLQQQPFKPVQVVMQFFLNLFLKKVF